MAYLKDGTDPFIAYNVPMNHTFWIDDRVVALARKKAQALGKSLDELIRDYLRTFADDDPEKSIAEFKRLSGRGNSSGWRFDRDEIHNRK
jgi:hypothetical protein